MICRRRIWRRGAQLAREARPVRAVARQLIADLEANRGSAIAAGQWKLVLLKRQVSERLYRAATRPLEAYCRRGIAAIDKEWNR